MEIIPAIDLRHGACVRLFQGDYSREEVFGTDPSAVAERWRDAGATMVHVVDLDGAAAGELVNKAAIGGILSVPGVRVEVGGGIRTLGDADWLMSNGTERVILGTMSVEEPALVRQLVDTFDGAIVVSLDARDGRIATRGWLVDTQVDVSDLCEKMREAGVSRFIYTDVRRDGTLTEPNFDAIERLVAGTDAPVVAAGGITTIEHIARLRDIGAAGAILGKSIYTGSIDLKEAIDLYGG
ncbi:MAG: 1-(5-phosphoribosyl)-5-[(5-phosphoribosylamino)methylideneamino]imidazole-4-carboxamide isomerase [Chloroflexota bacterium]